MTDEACIYNCPQCPKIFATRSNLKRHMENPNIHNIPYARSRDQKRWKDHDKKVSSRQETTERMRKWRAENRDKNKRNDLRCRVYRLARQKYGEEDSEEKQQFIQDEINRRLGRRMLLEQKNKEKQLENTFTTYDHTRKLYPILPAITTIKEHQPMDELPFYCAPLHKIELPSINMTNRRLSQSTEPSGYASKSQPNSPLSEHTSIDEDRRTSTCSNNSSFSNRSNKSPVLENILIDHHHVIGATKTIDNAILPPMQTRRNLICSQPPL